MTKCKQKCEVYSRVVGYHRPVANWNRGKKEEYKERKVFVENKNSGREQCTILEVCKPSP